MSHWRVLYNDDATPLVDVKPGRARDSLIELIDLVIDNVPVDIYAIECALPDLCEYETKVGEVIGRRFDKPPHARGIGIEALRAEGTDHLSVYVEHLHRRGVLCVPEVRMNDTHGRRLSPEDYQCSRFAYEHPQWVIERDDDVEEIALDYSFSEVREHRLAIKRELVTDYDTDGLELNFIRWAKHFRRDVAWEKSPIMTDYIRQVRDVLDAAAKQRGRDRLLLGVRMPADLEACRLEGCDLEQWVDQGWIDYVIAADYNYTDPRIQVEKIKGICKGKCPVYVQMGDMMGGIWRDGPQVTGRGLAHAHKKGTGYGAMLLTDAEARGASANHHAWGADGLSFWNLSCHVGTENKSIMGPEQRARMFSWVNEAIDPVRVQAGERRYHFLPLYKGFGQGARKNYAWQKDMHNPLGAPVGQVITFDGKSTGRRKVFDFRMADGRDGSALEGTMRFRVMHWGGGDHLDIDVNGHALSPVQLSHAEDPDNTDLNAVWFEVDLTHCPPLRGDNELGMTWRGALNGRTPYMEELDVVVR